MASCQKSRVQKKATRVEWRASVVECGAQEPNFYLHLGEVRKSPCVLECGARERRFRLPTILR